MSDLSDTPRVKVEVALQIRAATAKEEAQYQNALRGLGEAPRGAFPAPAGLVILCNPEALLEAAERLYTTPEFEAP